MILGSQKHTEKSFFYKLLHNFLGKGLITSSGEKWSTHRKLLQPTFHLNILEKFIGTFAASTRCLNEKLRDKSEINITTFINDSVLDILNGEKQIEKLSEVFSTRFQNFQNQSLACQFVGRSQAWKTHRSESKLDASYLHSYDELIALTNLYTLLKRILNLIVNLKIVLSTF